MLSYRGLSVVWPWMMICWPAALTGVPWVIDPLGPWDCGGGCCIPDCTWCGILGLSLGALDFFTGGGVNEIVCCCI